MKIDIDMQNKVILTEYDGNGYSKNNIIKETVLLKNIPKKCEICGKKILVYPKGVFTPCDYCGWRQDANATNTQFEKKYKTNYPNLVILSRAKKLYKAGKLFKPTLIEFLNGLDFYGEMEFDYENVSYFIWRKGKKIILENNNFENVYKTKTEFKEKAKINGKLLKDIWKDIKNERFV